MRPANRPAEAREQRGGHLARRLIELGRVVQLVTERNDVAERAPGRDRHLEGERHRAVVEDARGHVGLEARPGARQGHRARTQRDLQRGGRDDEGLGPFALERAAPGGARLQERLARHEIDLVGDVELAVRDDAPLADHERSPAHLARRDPGRDVARGSRAARGDVSDRRLVYALRHSPRSPQRPYRFGEDAAMLGRPGHGRSSFLGFLASLRIDRNERPPSPSSVRAVRWLIGMAVVGGAAVAAWHVGAPLVESKLFKTEVGVTEVALVSPAQAQVELTSTGYVVPQVEVDVSSKLVGRVEKATIREGSVIKRGEVLFELDASDQRTQVASSQARVAAARAREATARAQLGETALQLRREQKLAASGAVGTATADDLAARAKSLEEQVHATEADVAASQSEVTALSVNLANTTIRSPSTAPS